MPLKQVGLAKNLNCLFAGRFTPSWVHTRGAFFSERVATSPARESGIMCVQTEVKNLEGTFD